MKYTADCPECLTDFEVDGPAVASRGVTCHRCGHKFTPEKIHRVQAEESNPLPPPDAARASSQKKDTDKIGGTAQLLDFLSCAAVVIAVIILFFSAISRIGEGDWGAGPAAARGCFAFAMIAFFFAQLFHIRSALERLNNKD
jgi:predicted Zn finger-like uncharacterized protein